MFNFLTNPEFWKAFIIIGIITIAAIWLGIKLDQ